MEEVCDTKLPRQLLPRFCVFFICGTVNCSSQRTGCLTTMSGTQVHPTLWSWSPSCSSPRCTLGQCPRRRTCSSTSVHQTDSQRKKDGIASLNLVVFFSHYFVVVDTSDYLQRLWTLYEWGSFLVLKNGGVPTMLPVSLYVGIAVLSATSAIGNICPYVLGQTSYGDGLVHEHTSYFQFFLYTGGFGPVMQIPVMVILMRSWAREQHIGQVLLRSFSIKDARCGVEADRVPVCKNIRPCSKTKTSLSQARAWKLLCNSSMI